MATNTGFLSLAGVKLESVLGTPIAVDELVAIITANLVLNPNVRVSPGLIGIGGQHNTQLPPASGTGTIVFIDDNRLANPILTQAFGTLTTGTYDIVELTTTGFTYAQDRNVATEEYAGYQINQLNMTGNPTDGCRLTAAGFFTALSYASVINTAATLSALLTTAPPIAEMLFDDVTFNLGVVGGATAAVPITSYDFSLNRNMEQRLANSANPLPARENAKRAVTLTVTLPYDTETTHDTRWRTGVNLYGNLTWVFGGVTRILYIPLMRVFNLTGRDIAGEGANSPTITFQLLVDLADLQTGITNYDFGVTSRTEARIVEV